MRQSEKDMLKRDLIDAVKELKSDDVANIIRELLGIDCWMDYSAERLSFRGTATTKIKARHICFKIYNLLHEFLEIHSHGVELSEDGINWYVNIQ